MLCYSGVVLCVSGVVLSRCCLVIFMCCVVLHRCCVIQVMLLFMWFIVLLRCLAIQMFLSSCCALLFRCCVIKVMCYPDVVLSYPRVVLCIPGVVDARLERADRCLAEPLLLLTQQEVGPERLWMLPQTPWEAGETLKTTAQRALSATPGNKSHHFVYIHNLGSHC